MGILQQTDIVRPAQDDDNVLAQEIAAILPELALDHVWEITVNNNEQNNRENKFLINVYKIKSQKDMILLYSFRFSMLNAENVKSQTNKILAKYPFLSPEPVITEAEKKALGFYATIREQA